MTQPDLLTWRQAESRRDSGITRAVEHADRKELEWSEQAMSRLRIYAALNDQFMAEDVREYATRVGLPPPPDGRAWGAVFKRAAKAGHIIAIGWGNAKSSNCGAKRLWARA